MAGKRLAKKTVFLCPLNAFSKGRMLLTEFSTMSISVIIPTLNEDLHLPITLQALGDRRNTEIIIADAGSTDKTRKIGQDFGATVLETPRGRAMQMNAASQYAIGEVLLFLHADTVLPETWPENIRQVFDDPKVCGGAFSLGINGHSFKLRLIEHLADFRSRKFSLPYGDQAIFVRSSIFSEMGGFPDLPIMEDFEFMRRLRKKGIIRILPERAITSGRRWEQLGVLQTTLINQAMILGFYMGIQPDKLERFYRRKR